jgi:hypothetical protein
MKPLLAACSAALLLAAALTVAGCGTLFPSAADEEAPPDTTAPPDVPRTVPETPDRETTAAGAGLDTVRAGRFDQGRMWTFGDPPAGYFSDTYNFDPDDDWFREARLGALRIPGCSASFVSARGLVLTNHHCARDHLTQVSRPGEDLLENGFFAETVDEERPAPDMHADQLVAIEDVTGEVRDALADAQTDAERAEARQAVFERIKQRRRSEAGVENARVEVVSLYEGGRYKAYTFRRYENVRLVFAPELQLGYFGGNPDNFTYPRYALDMALFRVYDDSGEPIETEHYFEWDDDGAGEGEPVFIVGNPGSTSRLLTLAQFDFRRDVRDPAVLSFVRSRTDAYAAYREAEPDTAAAYDVGNSLFGLRNARKLYAGRVEALRDSVIRARRQDAQERFREQLAADTALQREYGDLFERVKTIQQEKRSLAPEYRAFFGQSRRYASATLRRARAAYQYLRQQKQGASDEALNRLREQILSVGAQPDGLDRRLIAQRLRDFRDALGDTSAVVRQIDDSPEAVAHRVVRESVLADSASAAQALEAGTLSMSDPALELTAAYFPRYRDYHSAITGLMRREQELSGELGRARYEVYGSEVPPDATFSLRLSDGRVEGYEYNGTRAAAHTSFFGMYDHFYSYGEGTPWDLPERWRSPPSDFDRNAELNIVSTNDIMGGNSGSPLLNRDLELVGVAFDGNIESLASDYIYLPERMRAISVDVRGMREALDTVYDADRLVLELMEGRFVESEERADALAR